jgi:hypothetical protein
MEMDDAFSDLFSESRARRYSVELPVEFRRIGNSNEQWFTGSTENMGTGGVLFRSTEIVEPNTQLEMIFHLPLARCRLVCIGVVLRTRHRDEATADRVIAATIEHYRFVRLSAQG